MSARKYAIQSMEFSIPNGYLRELHGAQVYGTQLPARQHEGLVLSAASFATPLEFLQELSRQNVHLHELSTKGELEMSGPRLQLYSLREQSVPDVGVLDFLSVAVREEDAPDVSPEQQRAAEQHYLDLYKAQGQFHLGFTHGVFGYRRESFSDSVQALVRMVKVLQGVPWVEFGDEFSRNTLLGKGQFHWAHPLNGELVPVDNFVFQCVPGQELKLEAFDGTCHLLGTGPAFQAVHKTFSTYALALRALAERLEGADPVQDRDEKVLAHRPCNPSAVGGRFVVRDIFFGAQDKHDEHDEYAAPALVFRTGQGHRASLFTPEGELPHVTFQALDGTSCSRTVSTIPQAVRLLADVLETGELAT